MMLFRWDDLGLLRWKTQEKYGIKFCMQFSSYNVVKHIAAGLHWMGIHLGRLFWRRYLMWLWPCAAFFMGAKTRWCSYCCFPPVFGSDNVRIPSWSCWKTLIHWVLWTNIFFNLGFDYCVLCIERFLVFSTLKCGLGLKADPTDETHCLEVLWQGCLHSNCTLLLWTVLYSSHMWTQMTFGYPMCSERTSITTISGHERT